jgi:hypothetical protein
VIGALQRRDFNVEALHDGGRVTGPLKPGEEGNTTCPFCGEEFPSHAAPCATRHARRRSHRDMRAIEAAGDDLEPPPATPAYTLR